MTNKDFEKMFNNVKPVLPSEGFKERVLQEARKIPITENKPINKFFLFTRRYMAGFACLIIMLVSVITLAGLYSENYYEVYLDINPSIELCVNRFGTISKVKCINEDAEKCLKGLKLKGKDPNEAIEEIASALNSSGYFDGDAELFVSGYSKNYGGVSQMVEALYYRLSDLSEECGYGVEVFTGQFTEKQREEAEEKNISPLKYSVITELLLLDDSYSFEELSRFAMRDLNKVYNTLLSGLTQEAFEEAKKADITPMHYQLIKALEDLGVPAELLSSYDTAELKELFVSERNKRVEGVETFIKEKAEEYGVSEEIFRIAYSIVERDSSYQLEDLLKKSLFELKALDYALDKYDLLTGLFG